MAARSTCNDRITAPPKERFLADLSARLAEFGLGLDSIRPPEFGLVWVLADLDGANFRATSDVIKIVAG
jgi:hypothetical protein